MEARFLQTICARRLAACGSRDRPADRGAPRPGSPRDADAASAVDAIGESDGPIGRWSPAWQVLGQPATEIVQRLHAGLITEFAAARQGETGDPQVVDAAQLEPAADAALRDPAAAVARLAPFPRELSVLEQARAGLPSDWEQVIAQERTELLATVRYIARALGSDGPEVVRRAAEFGRQANAVQGFPSPRRLHAVPV